MQKIYGANLEHVQAFVTGLCTTLSFLGSILVIVAYYIAKSKTNPKAARLIRNLAVADCIWFASVFIQAIFWIFTGPPGETGVVPTGLCYVLSPTVTISRVSSLMWTCVVAFDVLESVTKRSWFSSNKAESAWEDWRYFVFVYAFSLPGGIASIAIHLTKQTDFGCGAGYEPLGTWYEVLFYELAPILIGFLCNLFVFWKVRIRMGKRAFPLSVRKRRRRIMFNYIRVCIICWIPMMMFYFLEIVGVRSALLQVMARGLLYLTGFFNFLVFGMQDVYLKPSFQVCMESLCCVTFGQRAGESLMTKHLEKTVMFADENKLNADIIKDKKHLYRHHRLSREDKAMLYKLRPDLNMKGGDVELEDSSESDMIIADYGDQGIAEEIRDSSAHVAVRTVGFGGDGLDGPSRQQQGRPKSPPPPIRDSDSDFGSDNSRYNSTDSAYSYDAENPIVSMPSVVSARSKSGSSQGSGDGRPKSALKKGTSAVASPVSSQRGGSYINDQRNRSGGEFISAPILSHSKNEDSWFNEDPTESLLGNGSRQTKYSGSRSPGRAPNSMFSLVTTEEIDAASSSDDSDEEDDALYEALARTVSR
jgi:hypothetical protein